MRHTSLFFAVAAILAAGGVAACSAASNENGFGAGGGGGGTTGAGASGTGGGLFSTTTSGGGGGILKEAPPCEGKDPNIDTDGDGFTGAQGDCNDCTPQMNPGAQDYPGNNVDEDCNGTPDDNPTNCDGALDVQSSDPFAGAAAMGLCKKASGAGWGIKNAEYVTADGQPLGNYDPSGVGHGILTGFGPNVNPQEGTKLLALSSGTARQPTDPGYQAVSGWDKGYTSGSPPGYPKESPSCPGVVTGEPHDSAGLRIQVKTPSNAKSVKFNLDFYTYEFPNYICSTYNDFFVAMLIPKPANQPDGNISFDSQGNTISVNAGFLEVCHEQMAGGKNFPCKLGPAQLTGTGFDDDFGQGTNSAATGWLETSSPVAAPGQDITLLFAIWDSGDGILDSTVLLDNFHFDVDQADTVTTPIEMPK